ncbi:hypothetical protein LUZ60_002366 [Juncus effusus]|nr:hypothetical protein LUZ60_002366 [Juncus effusus]
MSSKSKPSKLKINQRPWLLFASVTFFLIILTVNSVSLLLRHANYLGRNCSIPVKTGTNGTNHLKIAIVSLSNRVEEQVWKNKKAYAKKNGYDFIDVSWIVDPTRPPSWSKILAIKTNLQNYDWIFWNDDDILVMNQEILLEDIIFGLIGHGDSNSTPDLILTEDFNGVNAGVFFVRKSEWSVKFLNTWWNQTSFIQFGSTKSGDNAALKYLTDSLPDEESRAHIRIPPMQCRFNSYPWIPSGKSFYRLIFSPWTTWQGAYSEGDFMVHLAGIHNKQRWVSKLLPEMKTSRRNKFF